MKKNLFIFLIIVYFALSASGQSISFYRENMVMKLDASHVTVTGEYSFMNNYPAEANKTVFFPLPLTTGELRLDSISIFDESEQTYIRHMRRLPSGLFFQLTFHGQEQKKIRIFYLMDHDGRHVRYLVMTHIQYWKKPIQQGTYTLQVEDPAIIIDSTSYKPDKVLSANASTIYTWRKVNFNPDRELDIWFHHK